MINTPSSRGFLALTVALSVAFGSASGYLAGRRAFSAGSPSPTSVVEKQVYVEESEIIDTVKKVSPSVVSIVITKDLPLYQQRLFSADDFFGGFNDPFFSFPFAAPEPERDSSGKVKREPRKIGGGTGFIVTADGLAVTNRHVVEDEEADYTVILNDRTEYGAEVVSRDTVNDIALVRLKSKDGKLVDGLPVAPLGDSDKLQVGQRVIAIGNALAEYENTVTTGVISAKGRSIVAGSMNSAESLINLLQTDAAINPGNSGGPLVDLSGQVVGISTAVASGAQGIGFAIPISDVTPAIESVKKNGRIIRPYLGVRYMMLDKKKADELKINVDGGALLTGDESKGEFAVVPGSPAEKAGLKLKDVILSVDGADVTLTSPLQNLIAKKKPGDVLKLRVWRSGGTLELKLTLGETQ